ncbi:Flp pilus assembly protein CpaB [Aeromicrobium terrae]|uniref:Flp pilus assembly protein CpaB n=1 Tax=Aeromicrobium terrae TaxID=2498846 RepID=UPI001650B24B|nr:Flp pilus assembly protein CpaB [Aeromicrobium terrae]
MSKRLIAVLVAGALGAVAVVLLVNYANDANDRAYDNAKLVKVLQVKDRIEAGTKVSEIGDSVETVELPKAAVVPSAVSDLDDLSGLSTTTELEPGEQLIPSRFAQNGAVAGSVDATIPKGYQELTLPLSAARAVGGVLRPGDHVGVVSSVQTANGDAITRLVKNQVLVTRIVAAGVDQTAGDGQGKALLVTLAVKVSEAGRIINTAEYGKVWLMKQNADTERGNGGFTSKIELGQK